MPGVVFQTILTENLFCSSFEFMRVCAAYLTRFSDWVAGFATKMALALLRNETYYDQMNFHDACPTFNTLSTAGGWQRTRSKGKTL